MPDALDSGLLNEQKKLVHKVELLISRILRFGVIASLALVSLGTLVSFVHHPDYSNDPASLNYLTKPGAAFPHTLSEVASGVKDFRGQSIVVIGLLLLISTPVIRVAVSVVAFVYLKDRIFILITAAVLMLLLLSFAIGKGEV